MPPGLQQVASEGRMVQRLMALLHSIVPAAITEQMGLEQQKSGKSKDGDKGSDGAEDWQGLTHTEEQLLSGQQTCVHLKVQWDSWANHCDVARLQDNVIYLS